MTLLLKRYLAVDGCTTAQEVHDVHLNPLLHIVHECAYFICLEETADTDQHLSHLKVQDIWPDGKFSSEINKMSFSIIFNFLHCSTVSIWARGRGSSNSWMVQGGFR